MFEDRKDAGRKLARALEQYADENVLVLAIPRGGVEAAFEVAAHLNADFSLLITRKLPYPDNPEAGFGAVAEDGSTFIVNGGTGWLSSTEIDVIKNEQIYEIKRRIKVLRGGKSLPKIENRTVILVDDGLAMGSTMRASILMCRKQNPEKIVAAVPVAGRDVAKQMQSEVDELVVLEAPPFFRAVAQVYKNWYDVSDQEVLEIMQKWQNTH
jgi:putative phosphoribosyl transferase